MKNWSCSDAFATQCGQRKPGALGSSHVGTWNQRRFGVTIAPLIVEMAWGGGKVDA